MRVVINQFQGIDVTPALPLAAGCLVATARMDPEIASAVHFEIEVDRGAIDEVVAGWDRPDLLGFSLYPWNSAYSLAVAEAARRAHPECLIVAGGPAVPRRPERARRFFADNPAVDVLVFSEGELAFCELVRARLHGDLLDPIGGIALRRGSDCVFTAPPRRVLDFAETGSPFLDGTFDELLARRPDRFSMALCETNRGCPFSCTFCDWSLTKQVVEYPLERVHAELEWVARRGFGHVMVADANFGIRRRDADIARYLAELKRRTGLPRSFYFYLTKNNHARNLETIEILQKAEIGCWVGIAVQDFDDDVLEAVKRSNIHTRESMKLRTICADRGIPTFNELIFGLPGQTYRSITETVARAMPNLPRHDFVVFLCRMIDNTELGDPESRERFAIETRRCLWKTSTPGWDPVVDEYQELVVGTRDLPLADWRRAFRFTYFAAALYNLRLLRVLLHHVVEIGGDLRDFVEQLVLALGDAPAGSVYAEIDAALDRYVDSILAGGAFVLPAGDGEGPAVGAEDAVAIAALARYDEFLAETETLAHELMDADPAILAESFRYQSLITPRWRRPEPEELELAHDWPTYVARGGTGEPLHARPTRVRYTPPPYTALPGFGAFATTHLSCLRARLDIGAIEPVDPAAPARARARSLAVLPL